VAVRARPFSSERLSRLAEIERDHFWFAGRRVLLQRLLSAAGITASQRVVDLGCGTGFNLRALAEQGLRVVGLDLRIEGLKQLRAHHEPCDVVQADATRLPFAAGSFDTALLLDVAEHVDDETLLAEVARILRPGGVAIVSVPAHPWLWSYRDEAAGHVRRYSRSQLADTLNAAGLQVVEMRYYQFVLFPAVVLARFVGRRRGRTRDLEDAPHPLLNAALSRINRAEASLSDYVRWPWGSTLAAVCRRN
jgi:SAM-dependent methyltransferase